MRPKRRIRPARDAIEQATMEWCMSICKDMQAQFSKLKRDHLLSTRGMAVEYLAGSEDACDKMAAAIRALKEWK